MVKKIVGVIVLLVVLALVYVGFIGNNNSNKESSTSIDKEGGSEKEQLFSRYGLKTNTAIASIPLNEVLGGGPKKDGIPAISNPKFISVSEALEIENKERQGVSVVSGNTARFYPYSILVWHEIVNDEIEGNPIIVTFCPLCGSAIVFDPTVNGTVREFGVSGKLWQSNLLMYDRTNESLWSQIIGEAVVGDDTETKLEVFPSQLITFKEFSEKYPDGEVLSRETGHSRNYNFYPYGDYDSNNSLYFPVSVSDNRLPSKELMFIVNTEESSVAFKRSDLLEVGKAEIQAGEIKVTAIVDGEEIKTTDDSGNELAGYIAMWFSWASHHQEDGFVWTK